MSSYHGYLLLIDDPHRAEVIKDRIAAGGEFTDVLGVTTWAPKRADIYLISLDGKTLSCACLGRKQQRVATDLVRVKFSDFMSLGDVPIAEILQTIGSRFSDYLSATVSAGGGRVPAKTWGALVAALSELRADSAAGIALLDNLRTSVGDSYCGRGYEILAEERDAFALALDVCRLDRSGIIRRWQPPGDENAAPFLSGLQAAEVREDTMIINDLQQFADWVPDVKYIVGAVKFSRGPDQLTILNANRTALEESLGVDLIYYNHTYESFVMVQYKRMTRSDGGRREAEYRPASDRSYQAELQRMVKFCQKHPTNHDPQTTKGYRLNGTPFYFKLCPSVFFSPLSRRLIPGRYFPLDYWKVLIESPLAKGPKGGTVISYNSGRYLGNKMFTDMVGRGWIGSQPHTSKEISAIIESALSAKRSVMLAIQETGDNSVDE